MTEDAAEPTHIKSSRWTLTKFQLSAKLATLHAITLRTLVISWLDRGNYLLSSFPNKSLKTLSVIQNAAVLCGENQ